MRQFTIVPISELVLIPVGKILDFSLVGSRVSFHYWGDPAIPDLIPGSLEISETSSGKLIDKEINWQIPRPSEEILTELEYRAAYQYVVTYKDKWGKQRVCGSPEHPLRLEIRSIGESISVSVSGKGLAYDPYL